MLSRALPTSALIAVLFAAACASDTVSKDGGSTTPATTSAGATTDGNISTGSSTTGGSTTSAGGANSGASASTSGGSGNSSTSTSTSTSSGSSNSSSSSNSCTSGTSSGSNTSSSSNGSGTSSGGNSTTGGSAAAPRLNFEAPTTSAQEAAATVHVQVNLGLAPAADLNVHYLVTGTALAGRDYTVPPFVTAAPGDDRVDIPIAVQVNQLITDDLTVTLILLPSSSTPVGDANTFVLTLHNTDIVPQAHDGALKASVQDTTEGVLTSNVVPGGAVDAVYTVASDPQGGGTVNILDASAGTYTYTAGSSPGLDSFTFTVTTGATVSAPATVNVNVTYPVPVITPPASAAYLRSTPVRLGDTLSFDATVDAVAQSDIACEVSTALDSADPAAVAGPLPCDQLPSLVVDAGAIVRGLTHYTAGNGAAQLQWMPTRQQRGTYYFHLTAQGLGDPGTADFVVTVDSPRSQATALFDAAMANLDATWSAPLAPLPAGDTHTRFVSLTDANSFATLEGGPSGSPWNGTWPYHFVTHAPGGSVQSATFGGTSGNANSYRVAAWLAPMSATAPGAEILSNLNRSKGLTLRQSAHTPGAVELAVGVSPSVAYHAAVQADRPVAVWTFDETTSPFHSAVNGVGLDLDFSQASASSVTPQALGLLMNDPSTGVTFHNAAPLQVSDTSPLAPGRTFAPQGQVTLEAWVQFDNLSATQTLIASRSSAQDGYALTVQTGNGAHFAFVFGSSLVPIAATSTTTPQTGGIYHLVGAYDGFTARLYVNGELEGAAHAGAAPAPTVLALGAQPDGSAPLAGTLDEVAVYDYPLSAAQAQRHYRLGAFDAALSAPYAHAVDADAPVAHWPLNEAAGTVAHNNVSDLHATYRGAFHLAHTVHDGARAAGFLYGDTGAVAAAANPAFDWQDGAVELWVRPLWQDDTQAQTLLSLSDGTNNQLTLQLIPGPSASAGFVAVAVSGGGSSSLLFPTGSASIAHQRWHQVVYVQIGSQAAVFLDGQLVATQTFFRSTSPNQPLTLGALPDGTHKFVGDMHDVAMYDRPLSQVDVQAHYTQHAAVACQSVTRLEDNQWHQIEATYDVPGSRPASAALLIDGVEECRFAPTGDGTATADFELAAARGPSPGWHGAAAQLFYAAGPSAGTAQSSTAFADYAATAESFRRVPEGDLVDPYAQGGMASPVYSFDAANPAGAGRHPELAPGNCGVNATTWKNLASANGSASLANFDMTACANGGVWLGDGITTPYALQFDGIDDAVELPPDTTDWSGGVTVEVWAKPESLASLTRLVDLGGGQDSNNLLLSLDPSQSDALTLGLFTDQGEVSVSASHASESGIWHQYVGTMELSAANQGVTWHLYRDGAELPVSNSVGSPTVTPPAALRSHASIGRGHQPADAWFEGQLGSVRLYRRGLNSAEVRQNCHMQAPRYGVVCP